MPAGVAPVVAWPPNPLRIAATAFIAGLSSWREVNRANNDAGGQVEVEVGVAAEVMQREVGDVHAPTWLAAMSFPA